MSAENTEMSKVERVERIFDYLYHSNGLPPVCDILNVALSQQRALLSSTHDEVVESFAVYGLPLQVSENKEVDFPDEEVRRLVIEIFGERRFH